MWGKDQALFFAGSRWLGRYQANSVKVRGRVLNTVTVTLFSASPGPSSARLVPVDLYLARKSVPRITNELQYYMIDYYSLSGLIKDRVELAVYGIRKTASGAVMENSTRPPAVVSTSSKVISPLPTKPALVSVLVAKSNQAT